MPNSPAREVVASYVERVWNSGELSAIRELCTDPYVRHDPGEATTMTHDDQIARVTHGRAIATAPDGESLHFDAVSVTGDDEYVTWIWNMTAPVNTELATMDLPMVKTSTTIAMCGVEIFQVVDGRIAKVWNPPVAAGFWS